MSSLKSLAKLRQYRKGMNVEEFLSTEFRQTLLALEKSIADQGLNIDQLGSNFGLKAFKIERSTQSFSAGYAKVLFQNNPIATTGILTTSGSVQITQDGYYDISGKLSINEVLSSSQIFSSRLDLDGSTLAYGTSSYGNGGLQGHSTLLELPLIYLKKDQLLEYYAYSDVNSTLTAPGTQCFIALKFLGT